MDTVERVRLACEIASYVVTILGLPIAVIVFLHDKKIERRDREYGTYSALDDKYIDFLTLCLANTRLNIYNAEGDVDNSLSRDEQKQQQIIFEILISIFQRAYLMYRDQSSKIRKEQWDGWNKYMIDWMRNNTFYASWEQLGSQWEENFSLHMNVLFKEVTAEKKVSVTSNH